MNFNEAREVSEKAREAIETKVNSELPKYVILNDNQIAEQSALGFRTCPLTVPTPVGVSKVIADRMMYKALREHYKAKGFGVEFCPDHYNSGHKYRITWHLSDQGEE